MPIIQGHCSVNNTQHRTKPTKSAINRRNTETSSSSDIDSTICHKHANPKTIVKDKNMHQVPQSVIPYEYVIVTPKPNVIVNNKIQIRVKRVKDPLKLSICEIGSKNFDLNLLIEVINNMSSLKIDPDQESHRDSVLHDLLQLGGVYEVNQLNQFNAFEFLDICGLVERDSSESQCHLCGKRGELNQSLMYLNHQFFKQKKIANSLDFCFDSA
ncbi:hypothetical protein RFI_03598 [Reticulomyxa filosa]|uniref:Uncharacterized protein n=1 Tax=Reticulomyxa filosa TaxID=46433 RepID=X6P5Y9_RETFI|nr:hypothetical protein RFI_03598 [Reticulomyxa filosa]|eukprot:ETO33504.1 hypothetical protein RFI_03598 [Reticulomyxa filosa]